MSITKEQIVDDVANMSVMEVVELVSMMEQKFGVSAASAVVSAAPVEAQKVEEKTLFDVVLTVIGDNKIPVVKAVRQELGLTIFQAKTLVESTMPVVLKEGVTKENAQKMKKAIEKEGATVEMK